jgi:N-acetyl-anhydromuramyl-L-alanine amidase AmpD
VTLRMRGVVVHTVGVKGDTTAAAIRKYHVEHNGWRDIGYHYVIRKDGTVEPGRPLTQLGAHTEGANDTIGICVTGDGDHEDWTDAQKASFCVLAADRLHALGLDVRVLCGHREAPAKFGAKPTHKTCPGTRIDCDVLRWVVGLQMSASFLAG